MCNLSLRVDYFHRKYFINYATYGPYGVVTVDRQPKKALESLVRMYGGSIPHEISSW